MCGSLIQMRSESKTTTGNVQKAATFIDDAAKDRRPDLYKDLVAE